MSSISIRSIVGRSAVVLVGLATFAGAATTATATGTPASGTAATAFTAAAYPGDPAGMVSIEDNDPSIAYSGGWKRNFDLFASGFAASTSGTTGATATFAFVGTKVSWIGNTSFFGGRSEVLLDGVSKATVDQYSIFGRNGVALWDSGTLAPGVHTLQIKVTGKRSLLSFGTWATVDRIRYTPAPLPSIGFTFDPAQSPVLTGGLTGTVTCSRALPVDLSYNLTQGTVTRTGTASLPCTGSNAVTPLPIDVTGLTNGPATITWTTSWHALNQSVTTPAKTATVTLTVATTIGLTLDDTGFRGDQTTFVGGSVSCSQAVTVNLTGTLPGGAVTNQQVVCPATGVVGFLLQWNVGSAAGVASITASALTADGTAGVTVTKDVTIN